MTNELTTDVTPDVPVQYVTGSTGFRRIDVAVGPGVFIPRPETEIVVEHAMERLPARGILVDVCTGSGAIALAVADERPDARVVATEISPVAFEWALRNRAALDLTVELVEGDLMDALPSDLRGNTDVVVSNPPYVAEEERSMLPSNVVDHEPHLALFAGPGGLEMIRRVAGEAREWLADGGSLVLEIGETQGARVEAMLTDLSYDDVRVHPDLTGRDRVVVATWRGVV